MGVNGYAQPINNQILNPSTSKTNLAQPIYSPLNPQAYQQGCHWSTIYIFLITNGMFSHPYEYDSVFVHISEAF